MFATLPSMPTVRVACPDITDYRPPVSSLTPLGSAYGVDSE